MSSNDWIRRAMSMPMTQILPNLYVGNEKDAWSAYHARMKILCVVEEPALNEPPGAVRIPIMQYDTSGQCYAHPKLVDTATEIIRDWLAAGLTVFVHCHMGCERSPLTIACYMVRAGLCRTIEDAYNQVCRKRDVVMPRSQWLRRQPIPWTA